MIVSAVSTVIGAVAGALSLLPSESVTLVLVYGAISSPVRQKVLGPPTVADPVRGWALLAFVCLMGVPLMVPAAAREWFNPARKRGPLPDPR